MTERQGPFFIERNGNIIVIRSQQPFSGTVSWEIQAEQQSAIYALPPFGLQRGMKLILRAEGHEDVMVQAEGEGQG